MTRDEALGESYSPGGLVIATSNGYLFDYIAQWYYNMSRYELKEVLLAVLGVGIDNCKGEDDELEYGKAICNELECRFFGLEDEDE